MTNTDMSLRDAAQAVIDRWDTPLWKAAPATAVFIADLRNALAKDAGRASLSANAGEPLVRYCPGCGSVGPVDGKYRDCCPDSGRARMIPEPLANQCRDTFQIAVRELLAAPPTAQAEVENLRKALQFYADKEHFAIAEEGVWDTVSGEPQNYWCDEAGTAMVEDGSIAKMALAGQPINFADEDEDEAAPPTSAEGVEHGPQ